MGARCSRVDGVFFDGWTGLGRTAISGLLGYLGVVLLLRASGKRTLSKMNMFDFIVTVAMGSVLATITLSHDVSLAEGMVAIGVLIGAQFVVTWCSVRSEHFQDLVKASPSLLYHSGEWLRAEMRRERVTEAEMLAAVRMSGFEDLSDRIAIVLETDGTLTVIERPDGGKLGRSLGIVKNSPRSGN